MKIHNYGKSQPFMGNASMVRLWVSQLGVINCWVHWWSFLATTPGRPSPPWKLSDRPGNVENFPMDGNTSTNTHWIPQSSTLFLAVLGADPYRFWFCSYSQCIIYILKMRINGNFRILKWRYCTIFLAIFCWDIMAIDEKLPEDAGLMEMPNTWLAHGLTTGNTHLVNLGFPKWWENSSI